MNCEIGEGRYFIYRHIRLDKNVPFYIGVGTKTSHTNTFNEVYRRAFLKAGRNNLWNKIVNKTGYNVEIIIESENFEYILQKETELIILYGRKDLGLGTLANLTDGGIGNQNMPKRKCSEETKQKMSNSSKGVLKSKEHRQALSIAKKGKPSLIWKGKKFSEDHKSKLKQRKAALFQKTFMVEENGRINEYNMTKIDLCKFLHLNSTTLNNCLQGKQPTKRKIIIYEKPR